MELEEYINLEQRLSGKMVLLDVSATGEENLIEAQSGNQMNDLEYRRTQLLKLQDAVIDLEDLSTGVSITELRAATGTRGGFCVAGTSHLVGVTGGFHPLLASSKRVRSRFR